MLTVLSYTVLMLLHSLWLLTLLQPHMSLYQLGCTQLLSRAFSLPFKEVSGCNSKQAVNAPKWHCSAFREVQWEQNWMCCRKCTPCNYFKTTPQILCLQCASAAGRGGLGEGGEERSSFLLKGSKRWLLPIKLSGLGKTYLSCGIMLTEEQERTNCRKLEDDF